MSLVLDMVGMAASFGATPTRDSLANFFHSRSAGLPGTRNYPGTKSRALDALIAGKRKLKYVPPEQDEGEQVGEGSGDSVRVEGGEDARGGPRTMASLLRVTFQVRHVTLKVLADALGLEFDEGGIGRCVPYRQDRCR